MRTTFQQEHQPSVKGHVERPQPRREPIHHQNQEPSYFFKLPLELRIMIYDYAISNQEINITRSSQLKHSAALLCTDLRITREIYQFCTISAIIDISAPFHEDFSVHRMYIFYSHRGHEVLRRMIQANKAVEKFRSVSGRRKLTMKVRVRCEACGAAYKDGGNQVCRGCKTFPECTSWNLSFSCEVRLPATPSSTAYTHPTSSRMARILPDISLLKARHMRTPGDLVLGHLSDPNESRVSR